MTKRMLFVTIAVLIAVVMSCSDEFDTEVSGSPDHATGRQDSDPR